MRPNLRTLCLTSALTLGGLLGVQATQAKAQLVVSTPGFALGVGAPVVAPAYPAYPAYGPVVGGYVSPYPVVRPYPFAYGRPAFYGPRFYGPRYYGPGRFYGYRRW
jgi:hypothetical protein